MAQPGNFTPILLYASSTPTNVPLAANLTNSATGSEIAINIADKNLFFKDSAGVVNTVPIRQSSTSSNGYLTSTDWNTFNGKQAALVSGTNIKTVGGVTLLGSGDVGTIGVAYGGTGITTTPTNGQIPIGNGTNYTAAAITAGINIAVTNGAGSISVATDIPTPQTTIYTSGSGTYTVPANTKYLVVEMVGGGGGGGGGGAPGTGGNGSAGGTTTFGASSCTGGVGNATSSGAGTATLGSGFVGLACSGALGQGFQALITGAVYLAGGTGAASPFGGNGNGGANSAGTSAVANSGSGGGGGGSNGTAGTYAGAGSGSGGYLRAHVTSPSASYSYAIGAAGTGGTAGTNGFAGGDGSSGQIIVTAFF